MKSWILIVAIVAFSAHLGETQPGPAVTQAATAAPTTAAPPATTKAPAAPVTTKAPSVPAASKTTFADIAKRISQDARLNNLTADVAKLQMEIATIEKVFELDIVFRNISQLNVVLNQVKAVRQQTAFIVAELHQEIASVPVRSFIFRLLQESLLIQTQRIDKLLKWIGLEILGDLSDVSKFENYYYSETVSIVEQLLLSKYFDILTDAYEADKLLDEAWKKDPLHGKIDAATKAQVDKYFHAIITAATTGKQELSSNYYEELEKIRLDNRELNLQQRFQTELAIDLFNYLISFTTKYDQLFLKLN